MKKTILLLILCFQNWVWAGDVLPPPMLLLVGDGSGQCTYTSIQDAIDDASPNSEIRVTMDNGTYEESLSISKSLTLKGGYSSCGLAQLDSRVDSNYSIISGASMSTVMIISGTNLNVDISGFNLISGQNFGFSPGGGMTLTGIDNTYDLDGVIISSSSGSLGGGIFISGDSELNLLSTRIFSNNATLGGGLYCSNSGLIHLKAGSGIFSNNATNGGGVYANDCEVRLQNGLAHQNEISLEGISANQSTDHGGGIYIDESTLRFMTDHTTGFFGVINIDNNISNTDGDAVGDGGGIYALDSEIHIAHGYFYQNTVLDGNGGALYLDDSQIKVNGVNGCLGKNNKCIWFEKNTARKDVLLPSATGGAIYANNHSEIGISGDAFKGYFIGNRADQASAISLSTGSFAKIRNAYFIENGESGSGMTSDISVIRVNGLNTDADISFSTFAHNQSNVVFDIENSGNLSLWATIVSEPNESNEVITATGSSYSFACSIFHESNSIGPINAFDNSVVDPNPGFVNPVEGNFHIRYDSIAIDKCSLAGIDGFISADYDNDTRGIDFPNIINDWGTYDAGADEYNDVIFNSGFDPGASSAGR